MERGKKHLNKNRTSKFASCTSTASLVLLVWALIQSPVHAASYSYQLPDGTLVTLSFQSGQSVITLTGQPNFIYQIDATEDLTQWVTLQAQANLGLTGTFTYTDTRGLPKCFYRVIYPTASFTSISAQDGLVAEYPETSNAGAFALATNATSSALLAGDYDYDLQLKSIVSFDTSSIPDGATVVSATLKLRRGTVVGTNPFTTHGACFIDIKGGTGFGGSNTLAAADFQAPADATQVGTLSNALNDGDWSTGTVNATGLSFINKTGTTQFRVYFSLDDNDDESSDYIGWYSGDNSIPANRPILEVVYR